MRIPRAEKNLLGIAQQRSPKQESGLAKRMGARTTKASGAKHEKGDVRDYGVARVECKTTSNKSFSLTREMFYKLASTASGTKEIPIMDIEFLNENGGVECNLAVLQLDDLMKLLGHDS